MLTKPKQTKKSNNLNSAGDCAIGTEQCAINPNGAPYPRKKLKTARAELYLHILLIFLDAFIADCSTLWKFWR